MLKGVMFGTFHSYLDFGLILSSKTIETPSAKTETVNVPGADGELDLTEYFGGVKYKNRKLSFEFHTIAEMSEFLSLFSNVQNAIHGKKLKIVLDDDPDFYYVGRITVNQWKSDGRIGTIAIDCDCEPYKYKKFETIKTDSIVSHEAIVYLNLRKDAVPKFVVDGGITLTFGTVTTILNSAGEYTIPEIVFGEGENTIVYDGTATVTVKYQEGGV